MKRALICGIGGQDGSYLAELLLGKGYEVFGSSRDAQASAFPNLRELGLLGRVETVSIATNDFRSVLQALRRIRPDEIYNLSGQSSVGLSFDQPVETMESIGIATLNLLEAIRFLETPTRFYSAGSSECFGNAGDEPCNEASPLRPLSPYAVAKSAAFWQVSSYRQAYGMHASSGILFNHESPLRPERFVTKKAVAAACRIAQGSNERLHLGNLAISRDWGWAPEYVEAMWRMLQRDTPDDYVIATGVNHTLSDFVATVFAQAGLDWQDHVSVDPSLFRPNEMVACRADTSRAHDVLGWRARYTMPDVARMMVEAETARLRRR
jgi:GDPmannose 4,6-dehydratase